MGLIVLERGGVSTSAYTQQGWIGYGLLGACIITFNILEDSEDIRDLHGIANDDTVLGMFDRNPGPSGGPGI